MKPRVLKKLIERQRKHIVFKRDAIPECKERYENELEHLDKLGIFAFNCGCELFTNGDLMRFTFHGSRFRKTKITGRFVMTRFESLVIYNERKNKIYLISPDDCVLIELLDIASDSVHEFDDEIFEKNIKINVDKGTGGFG